MAISEYNYIPTYIKRTIDNKPKDVVTASYWNELFNLLITQGDHTAEELGSILNHFTGVITDLANDTSQATSGLSNKLGDLNNLATTDKTSLVASINEVKGIADGKQDAINDLESIRTGAAKGATALQSVPNTYRTAAAQDVIDNGLSGRVSAIEGKEAGWNGKYAKPADGIPKTDLANDVQASLGKADTALQEHQSLVAYRTSAAQDIIDNGKQDKLIAGDNITIAADGKTISATGGGGILPITLTLGSPIQLSNGTAMYYTADRSRDEIKAAIDAGITVLQCSLIHADNPNEVTKVLYLNFSSMDSSAFFVGVGAANAYYELSFPITSSVEGMLKLITLPTGSDFETVESQLVDIPSKLSQFTNDAGYLTLNTLPKYDGSVT